MYSGDSDIRQGYDDSNGSHISYDIAEQNQIIQTYGQYEDKFKRNSDQIENRYFQTYENSQRSKKVFNSIQLQAQRQPIQELHLQSKTIQSKHQGSKYSEKRSSRSSNPISNNQMDESKVQTVYKDNYLDKIDQENFIERSSSKKHQPANKFRSPYQQKYSLQNDERSKIQNVFKRQVKNQPQSAKTIQKSEQIRHFPVYSNIRTAEFNNLDQYKNEASDRVGQLKIYKPNQHQQDYEGEYDNIDQSPTVHYSFDARQYSILLYKYESNKRLIIRQINELLKLNQANQLQLDFYSVKSKISSLTVICRRMRVNMRSRSLKNAKGQHSKSYRKFYGDHSPTKRLPGSLVTQQTKEQSKLLMLIKQQKDRLTKSNIRVVQLDNYIKARKNQISLIQQDSFYDEDDPYRIQLSLSTVNNNKKEGASSFGQFRHKAVLFEKRKLIKQSLQSMVDYRSRKIEQANQEINILKRQLQIVNQKIQRTKNQNKTILQDINQQRKPKIYSGSIYSQLKAKASNIKQSSQPKVTNFKYAQLHVDYNDLKQNKKQLQNKGNRVNSYANAGSSRNSSAKSNYTQKCGVYSKSSKNSKHDTPSRLQKNKHAKSSSSFYQANSRQRIAKKQKINQNVYNQYFQFNGKSEVNRKKINHGRKHSQQYR